MVTKKVKPEIMQIDIIDKGLKMDNQQSCAKLINNRLNNLILPGEFPDLLSC